MNVLDATEISYKNGYAKGIKDFAERLKEPFETYADAGVADALYIVSLIDGLVKEMTEGKTE